MEELNIAKCAKRYIDYFGSEAVKKLFVIKLKEKKMEIWKYTLNLEGVNEISIPGGGHFLDLQVQKDVPVMWILLDPQTKPVERIFKLICTGQEFDSNNKVYKGTIQLGEFVLHLFEYCVSYNDGRILMRG